MISKDYITFVPATLLTLSCISCSILTTKSEQKEEPSESLWHICTELRNREFVDLTHAFGPSIPHWKGYEPMRVRNVYEIDEHGFWAQEFTHVGQWGTHCDPPAHFHKGLRTIDQIEPKEMFLPLVVIDVHIGQPLSFPGHMSGAIRMHLKSVLSQNCKSAPIRRNLFSESATPTMSYWRSSPEVKSKHVGILGTHT
jgi:hypothetical protein